MPSRLGSTPRDRACAPLACTVPRAPDAAVCSDATTLARGEDMGDVDRLSTWGGLGFPTRSGVIRSFVLPVLPKPGALLRARSVVPLDVVVAAVACVAAAGMVTSWPAGAGAAPSGCLPLEEAYMAKVAVARAAIGLHRAQDQTKKAMCDKT